MAYRFPPYWAEMHGPLDIPEDILEILNEISIYDHKFDETPLHEISSIGRHPPHTKTHQGYTLEEWRGRMENRVKELDDFWFIWHGKSHCLRIFKAIINSSFGDENLEVNFGVQWDPLEFAMVPMGIRIEWVVFDDDGVEIDHFDGEKIEAGSTYTTHMHDEKFGRIISKKLNELCTHTGMAGMAWRGYF